MTLEGTNTYVVGREPAFVIDPGPDDPGHLAEVQVVADSRGGIAGVLLTHGHADHGAGVAALGAPLVWGTAGPGDEMRDPGAGTSAVAARATDAGPFAVIPTPGHAPDHVCFVADRVCFCGDLILGWGSSIVPPAAHGGSLVDYMTSLRRVAELDVDLLAPGHGPPIADPAAKVAEYIAHRADRERRLVAALESGERSRSRLVDIVWDEVPEPLRPAAAIAMQAHLEKLADEDRLPGDLTA
ncbi:MAG: MBL fold metallo-hydrolase [Solirubrobacterales bacterium]|nr:MBL fold metallo-hydrolase [Solirubrobacterales bacterium]